MLRSHFPWHPLQRVLGGTLGFRVPSDQLLGFAGSRGGRELAPRGLRLAQVVPIAVQLAETFLPWSAPRGFRWG